MTHANPSDDDERRRAIDASLAGAASTTSDRARAMSSHALALGSARVGVGMRARGRRPGRDGGETPTRRGPWRLNAHAKDSKSRPSSTSGVFKDMANSRFAAVDDMDAHAHESETAEPVMRRRLKVFRARRTRR